MSAKVTGFILDNYPHGGAEKLVALALADEANADGDNIFPGVARLARRCCMSERGVQKILRRIESREINGVHWFEQVRMGGGGRHVTNRYRCPISALDEEVRKRANAVRPLGDETTNIVQGNNPEHHSGFAEKPRTQRLETPNGGSPDPLYPPNHTVPARASDGLVPQTVSEWGNHLIHQYGFALHEVMSVSSTALFRDWIQRQLPIWLVDDAIAAANAKNGARPGSPAFYRNFVNQLSAELETAQQARASARAANFSRPPQSNGGHHARVDRERDDEGKGVAGFYADFGRD